jgi:hypothetical protein
MVIWKGCVYLRPYLSKALGATLSQDGKWIAYRGRDNSSLYLVHTDGSGMHLVLDNTGASGVEWSQSGWLGVSLTTDSDSHTAVIMVKPDSCQIYRLPFLQGELEGLSIP